MIPVRIRPQKREDKHEKKDFPVFLASAMALSLLTIPSAGMTGPLPVSADELEDDLEDEADLVVTLLTFTPMSVEITDRVEERLNEITQEKINATVDFEWKDAGQYLTTVPMMLQANEQIDLIMFTPIPAASYQSFMSQNQLMDITDLLPVYAPDVCAYMGDYLKATSKSGSIYGVGNLYNLKSQLSIDMRKDILEDAGLLEEAESMTNWQDVKEVMKKASESSGMNALVSLDDLADVITMAPFVIGNGDLADTEWLDSCGDTYYFTYIDPADDKVKCYFENEKWLNGIKLAREFYNEGLVFKDALTSPDTGVTLIRSGVGFAQISPTDIGAEAMFKNSTGYDDFRTLLTSSKASTATFQKFGFAVPITAGYPERALRLLNLMWTDQEFMDTLAWGIEGEDWVRTENGMADYPEGTDSNSVYHLQDFMLGNTNQVIPWTGDDPDIRQHTIESNESVELSKYLGFSVDSVPVAEKVSACKFVFDQYCPPLNCGAAGDDVDALAAEFIEAMYGAGLQDIIDEYQAQLDAWLAENS